MIVQELIENQLITFEDFERFLQYYDVIEGAYYAEPPDEVHNNFYGKLLTPSEIETFQVAFPYFKGNADPDTNPYLAIELLYQPMKLTY